MGWYSDRRGPLQQMLGAEEFGDRVHQSQLTNLVRLEVTKRHCSLLLLFLHAEHGRPVIRPSHFDRRRWQRSHAEPCPGLSTSDALRDVALERLTSAVVLSLSILIGPREAD